MLTHQDSLLTDTAYHRCLAPQTWEDPSHANTELNGVKGDNDPVDVVEIGAAQLEMGGVYEVRHGKLAYSRCAAYAQPF